MENVRHTNRNRNSKTFMTSSSITRKLYKTLANIKLFKQYLPVRNEIISIRIQLGLSNAVCLVHLRIPLTVNIYSEIKSSTPTLRK